MKLNLLKPLKRIFTALTGEETNDKSLVTIMDKIADTVEESGGSSGGGAPLIVTVDAKTAAMEKTFAEIKNAYARGNSVMISATNDESVSCLWSVVEIMENTYASEYSVSFLMSGPGAGIQTYVADSEDGYPLALPS